MTEEQKNCPHEKFHSTVNIARLQASETDTRITGFSADIKIWCEQCNLPFEFIGVQNGHSYKRPMVSADFQELHAPIRPNTDSIATNLHYEVNPENKQTDDTAKN